MARRSREPRYSPRGIGAEDVRAVPEARESLRPLLRRLAALRSPSRTPPASLRRGGCAAAVADRSGVRRSWSTRAAGNSVRCALCASLRSLRPRLVLCAALRSRTARRTRFGSVACLAPPHPARYEPSPGRKIRCSVRDGGGVISRDAICLTTNRVPHICSDGLRRRRGKKECIGVCRMPPDERSRISSELSRTDTGSAPKKPEQTRTNPNRLERIPACSWEKVEGGTPTSKRVGVRFCQTDATALPSSTPALPQLFPIMPPPFSQWVPTQRPRISWPAARRLRASRRRAFAWRGEAVRVVRRA